MAIDNSDLDAAKQAIERSVTQFNTNLATIYTFDGKRIYPPGKHENELAQLSAGVEKNVEKALALADRTVAEVEAARLSVFADPVAALDYAQLGLAGQYAPFVREDCERLPAPELVGRLEWAAKHPGAYLRLLYGRYGLQRFNAMLSAKPQPDGIAEMRAALEALGAIGQSRGLSPEQQRLGEAAQSLRMFATRQLRIAKDPEQEALDRKKSAETVRSLF